MERTFSTDAAADMLGVKPSRLREADTNGFVSPQRLPNNVRVWRERDLAVAALVFTAIDAGAPPYAARMLAERLAPLKSAEEIEDYASRLAIYEERGLWRLANGNLDGRAMELARRARRAGSRVIMFNTEEK